MSSVKPSAMPTKGIIAKWQAYGSKVLTEASTNGIKSQEYDEYWHKWMKYFRELYKRFLKDKKGNPSRYFHTFVTENK